MYFIGGTKAALSLPSLTFFEHEGERNWRSPMRSRVVERVDADSYAEQLRHFADVALRRVDPLIDALDGYRTLAVAHAIEESQSTGASVTPAQEVQA